MSEPITGIVRCETSRHEQVDIPVNDKQLIRLLVRGYIWKCDSHWANEEVQVYHVYDLVSTEALNDAIEGRK